MCPQMNSPDAPCLPYDRRRVVTCEGGLMFIYSLRRVLRAAILVFTLFSHSDPPHGGSKDDLSLTVELWMSSEGLTVVQLLLSWVACGVLKLCYNLAAHWRHS